MRLLASALAIMAMAAAFAGENLKLASGGKALFKIAISEQPNKFDKFACEDLQSYLGRMSGAEFSIVKESELAKGESAIYVGKTNKAAELKLNDEKFGREEWCIRTPDAQSMVLTGGGAIGAFYGAWRVLNHLGCYAITWDQDAIPSAPELVYDGFEERRSPAFGGRMIYDHQISLVRNSGGNELLDKYYRWILKNYVNGRQDNAPMPHYLSGVFNIPHYPQYHSMESYLPADKYFKDHPEYFWMVDSGERMPPPRPGYTGGLCLSNPDVIRLVTEHLLEMIKTDRETIPKDEWPYVYDISRLDGSRYYCKCPKCLEIVEREGSQECLLYWFLNQVSTETLKQYPDVIIRTFCGINESEKPERTMPMDNILLWVSDNYQKSDCFRPLSHPINADAKKELEGKMRDGKHFMMWDYWNLGGAQYFTPPRVETNFDAVSSDLRYFHEIGCTDIFIESSLDDAVPQNFMPLCYFVADQMMLDLDADAEKLADIFIRNYYGPNADLVWRWFKEIRKGVSAETMRQPSQGAKRWTYCTPQLMFDLYMDLRSAAEALPEDNVYRKRIEYERTSVVWAVIADKQYYGEYFTTRGVEMADLKKECRELAWKCILRYGGRPERVKRIYASTFEDRFNLYDFQVPVPERFKDVPKDKIAIVGYPAFVTKRTYGAEIVEDKEATCGRAFCGAHSSDDFHGKAKVIAATGKHEFKTTYFEAAQAKLLVEDIPQDEAYHWYKMNGKATIKKDGTCFWGQGWAIHARLGVLYDVDVQENNKWDNVWFRAKFTGPAYVDGSAKKNGIYIDLVVFTRD